MESAADPGASLSPFFGPVDCGHKARMDLVGIVWRSPWHSKFCSLVPSVVIEGRRGRRGEKEGGREGRKRSQTLIFEQDWREDKAAMDCTNEKGERHSYSIFVPFSFFLFLFSLFLFLFFLLFLFLFVPLFLCSFVCLETFQKLFLVLVLFLFCSFCFSF